MWAKVAQGALCLTLTTLVRHGAPHGIPTAYLRAVPAIDPLCHKSWHDYAWFALISTSFQALKTAATLAPARPKTEATPNAADFTRQVVEDEAK